ncbi:hypothetical protein JCM19232_609 [Vibrio ishigakensis]|uniref:Outer membrane protein beta-barrel domain-containing protein n=1 Tax=Vibrio ishigakensis TaxID=1481914 RepID=A0A0B8P230_9VIBR|nr:hypothetical protein JCM19232_609 [Vibrio ishigakensis]
MKRALVALAVSSVSLGAVADDNISNNSHHNTSINIGYVSTQFDALKDAGFDGSTKGVAINVKKQINDYLALKSTFQYSTLSEDAYNYSYLYASQGKLKATLIRGGGDLLIGTTLRANEDVSVRPYALVGAFYQSINSDANFNDGSFYSGSSGDFGLQYGVGVELELNKQFVINTSYTLDRADSEDSDTLLITAGYKF